MKQYHPKVEKRTPTRRDILQAEADAAAVKAMAGAMKLCATPNQGRAILSLKRPEIEKIWAAAHAAFVATRSGQFGNEELLAMNEAELLMA